MAKRMIDPRGVIVDYPFITGRSTPDSVLTGQKMIEVLDGNPPLGLIEGAPAASAPAGR